MHLEIHLELHLECKGRVERSAFVDTFQWLFAGTADVQVAS